MATLATPNAAETLYRLFIGDGPKRDPKSPHAYRATPPRNRLPREIMLNTNRAPLPRRFVTVLAKNGDGVVLAKFDGFRP